MTYINTIILMLFTITDMFLLRDVRRVTLCEATLPLTLYSIFMINEEQNYFGISFRCKLNPHQK